MVSRKGGTGLFVTSKSPYEPLKPRAIQRMVRAISQRAGLDKARPPAPAPPYAMQTLRAQRRHGRRGYSAAAGPRGRIATTQIYAEMSDETIRHQYNKYVAVKPSRKEHT